jgi:amino acid transporter
MAVWHLGQVRPAGRWVNQACHYEFTLSTFKLMGLAIFILACLAAVLGLGISPLGTSNFTPHGGFLPLGVSGLFTSFLLVFYAYTGIEMVSVTAEESVKPERDVPRALMGTALLVTVTLQWAAMKVKVRGGATGGLGLNCPYPHAGTRTDAD